MLFYVEAIAVVTENRIRSIINDKFSSFNSVALLHSTLANVPTPQSQGWGTMAAAGRRRPPWLGCFCCSLVSKMYKCTDSYIEKGGQINDFIHPVAGGTFLRQLKKSSSSPPHAQRVFCSLVGGKKYVFFAKKPEMSAAEEVILIFLWQDLTRKNLFPTTLTILSYYPSHRGV